jgi:hypothetical protein
LDQKEITEHLQDKADDLLTQLAERVRIGAMGLDAALAHAFIAGARYVAVGTEAIEDLRTPAAQAPESEGK